MPPASETKAIAEKGDAKQIKKSTKEEEEPELVWFYKK